MTYDIDFFSSLAYNQSNTALNERKKIISFISFMKNKFPIYSSPLCDGHKFLNKDKSIPSKRSA